MITSICKLKVERLKLSQKSIFQVFFLVSGKIYVSLQVSSVRQYTKNSYTDLTSDLRRKCMPLRLVRLGQLAGNSKGLVGFDK